MWIENSIPRDHCFAALSKASWCQTVTLRTEFSIRTSHPCKILILCKQIIACHHQFVTFVYLLHVTCLIRKACLQLTSSGPRQANLVLIAYASSEGSGEQSRQNLRCSLIQAVSQEEPSDRKPDPWPLWMAGHAQLKFVMTECSKTQIRLTGLILSWLLFLVIMSTLSANDKIKHLCLVDMRGQLSDDHNMSRSMTKPTKSPVCLAKIRISLGIRSVWSDASLGPRHFVGYVVLWLVRKHVWPCLSHVTYFCFLSIHRHTKWHWFQCANRFLLSKSAIFVRSMWARSCENVSYAICEQQRHRSASASTQSDQHLSCCLLLR